MASSLATTFSTPLPPPPHHHPTTIFLHPKPITFPSFKTHSTPPETIYFENLDDPQGEPTFNPPEKSDDFQPPKSFDEDPMEPDNVIAQAYEELYGTAYSGESLCGNDVYVMDSKVKKTSSFGKIKKEKVRDGFDERVVQVRRVTKVVKGGPQLHFRAVVVVGDQKGNVGVRVGKAKEVVAAVQESATNI